MSYSDIDPFWAEQRAKFLAEKGTAADPNACGTCRNLAEAGKPVEHDECQQRATLLHAPDHPHYELLAGFSLEENAKLPARFHVPVFDDCGVPNSWLCAVCQEEGVVTGWPCATATKYGTQVFTPQHAAETAQEKQAARIAELEAERHTANEALSDAAEQLRANRDQLGELEENLRAVNAGWAVARSRVAELEKATEQIETVRALCDAADHAGISSGGWFTVDAVRRAITPTTDRAEEAAS